MLYATVTVADPVDLCVPLIGMASPTGILLKITRREIALTGLLG